MSGAPPRVKSSGRRTRLSARLAWLHDKHVALMGKYIFTNDGETKTGALHLAIGTGVTTIKRFEHPFLLFRATPGHHPSTSIWAMPPSMLLTIRTFCRAACTDGVRHQIIQHHAQLLAIALERERFAPNLD